jgi:hypothetical protein
MENSTIYSCLVVAHSYRGSLGQAQLARPMAPWRGRGQSRHRGELTNGSTMAET